MQKTKDVQGQGPYNIHLNLLRFKHLPLSTMVRCSLPFGLIFYVITCTTVEEGVKVSESLARHCKTNFHGDSVIIIKFSSQACLQ